MQAERCLRYSYWLWLAGFATITLDKIAVLTLSGFHCKLAYFFFAASIVITAWGLRKELGFLGYIRALLAPLIRAPWVFMLALLAYSIAISAWSVAPKKTLGYNLWFAFDLIAIVAQAQYLASRRAFQKELFLKILACTIFFFGSVIIADEIAYYALGSVGGLIGYNQDSILHWGVSRPHAFSYEPSYIALFLVFGEVFLFSDACLTKNKEQKLNIKFSWFTMAIGLLAIISITSRAGWITLFICILLSTVIAFLKERKIPRRAIYYFFFVLLCGVVFFYITPQQNRKLMNKNLVHASSLTQDGSANSRVQSMFLGLQIGARTHGVGTGLGASYLYWMRVVDPLRYAQGLPLEEQGAEVMMSTWAELAAELGLVGIILYSLFAIYFCSSIFVRVMHNSAFENAAFSCAFIFFVFTAHWYGNAMRSDVWVWYAIWRVAFVYNIQLPQQFPVKL